MNSKAKVMVGRQICCGHGLKGYEKAWQMCPYFQLNTSIFLFPSPCILCSYLSPYLCPYLQRKTPIFLFALYFVSIFVSIFPTENTNTSIPAALYFVHFCWIITHNINSTVKYNFRCTKNISGPMLQQMAFCLVLNH